MRPLGCRRCRSGADETSKLGCTKQRVVPAARVRGPRERVRTGGVWGYCDLVMNCAPEALDA
jgi:hypothetical protein